MSKIIHSAEQDSLSVYLKKIWQHRSLIVTLAKRDLKIKYAQTILGLAWTVVQPLVAVAIYTFFFSLLINFQTKYPYPLFVLSGILFWGLFSYIFSQSSNCLQSNQDLIKKLPFPKIILPTTKVLVGLVEFVIIAFFFLVLFIFYKQELNLKILIVPLLVFMLCIFSLGLSLILISLSLKNRDLNHIIPFLVNFGIWLTPVFYPVNILPESIKNLIYLNPMASFIDLFRWCMFNEPFNPFMLIGISLSFVIFMIGLFSFRKMEDKIIDLL